MGHADDGFTLIEILVTVAILPIVLGGIAVSLVSVFSLQSSVANRIGDSNDARVASANFNRDVQSAQRMTTQSTPGCGTSTQTQILGLEWGANSSATPGGANGYDTVVSYISTPVVNPQTNKTTYALSRQLCTFGTSTSVAAGNTSTIAHDIGTPTVTIYGAAKPSPPNPPGTYSDLTSQFSTWTPSLGVTKVSFGVQAPGSTYQYSLVGLPGASKSQSSASNLNAQGSGPGCGFATSGSGTYSNHLCFADFTGFNGQTSGTCQSGQSMQRSIANTPYTLSFCISATGTAVAPAAIPTYYNPSGDNSEAFLGNNGFYTGIPGNPALYTQGGGVATVSLTNIQVLDAAGQAASGWTLVTGDAESTDNGEWMVFQSNLKWTVLNNNGASDPYGNSCYAGPPVPPGGTSPVDANNNGFLQYVPNTPLSNNVIPTNDKAPLPANGATFPDTGATSVLCESNQQLNKTGALMLQAQEPTGSAAAQTLTVTMRGAGLEGMFVGVLL